MIISKEIQPSTINWVILLHKDRLATLMILKSSVMEVSLNFSVMVLVILFKKRTN